MEEYYRYDSNDLNSDNSIHSEFNSGMIEAYRSSKQLNVIFKKIKEENKKFREKELKLSTFFKKMKRNDELLQKKEEMIQAKMDFLDVRKIALEKQKLRTKILLSELEKEEYKVNCQLEKCRKRDDEILKLVNEKNIKMRKVENKKEEYLERVQNKKNLEKNLRGLKGERNENMMELIIASSKEKKEIIAHHEKLVKNKLKLSALFKTFLEKANLTEKDEIRDLCQRYHLEDQVNYNGIILMMEKRAQIKKKKNMEKLRRVHRLKKRLEELQKFNNKS